MWSLSPTLPRRPLGRLDVTAEGVRLIRGAKLKQSLRWDRLQRVEWGELRPPKRRFGRPPKRERRWPYIRFVGSYSLESIRVTPIDYDIRLPELEQLSVAMAELAQAHAIPVEHRELDLSQLFSS